MSTSAISIYHYGGQRQVLFLIVFMPARRAEEQAACSQPLRAALQANMQSPRVVFSSSPRIRVFLLQRAFPSLLLSCGCLQRAPEPARKCCLPARAGVAAAWYAQFMLVSELAELAGAPA